MKHVDIISSMNKQDLIPRFTIPIDTNNADPLKRPLNKNTNETLKPGAHLALQKSDLLPHATHYGKPGVPTTLRISNKRSSFCLEAVMTTQTSKKNSSCRNRKLAQFGPFVINDLRKGQERKQSEVPLQTQQFEKMVHGSLILSNLVKDDPVTAAVSPEESPHGPAVKSRVNNAEIGASGWVLNDHTETLSFGFRKQTTAPAGTKRIKRINAVGFAARQDIQSGQKQRV